MTIIGGLWNYIGGIGNWKDINNRYRTQDIAFTPIFPGIAFYRLLLIKYWKAFEWISKSNMCFLILAAGIAQCALGTKVVEMVLTPKATTAYNCFYAGNFVKQLSQPKCKLLVILNPI